MLDVQPSELLKKPLFTPKQLLMGPGPSNLNPRVQAALTNQTVGPMQAECFQLMDEVKAGIQYLFQTKNKLTLAVSSCGHGAIEATLCNILEPGDKILVCVNGLWGQKATAMATRYGANVYQLKKEAGDNYDFDELEEVIAKFRPVMLFTVQGESTTGVYQPIEGLGEICHRYNCLLAVDAVASAGAVPLYTDKWDIDIVYTGSQKVLGAPPGLSPISFNQRALEHVLKRKTPVAVYYWDIIALGEYWGCFDKPRTFHNTISATLLYALRESLAIMREEGIENIVRRHQICGQRLQKGLKEIGLDFFVEEKKRLCSVTTILPPANIKWREICEYCYKNYNMEVAGGLGPTENKVIRIGVMGYNATFDKVDFCLKVLKEAVDNLGASN